MEIIREKQPVTDIGSSSKNVRMISKPTAEILCDMIDARGKVFPQAYLERAAHMIGQDATSRGIGIEQTLVSLKSELAELLDRNGFSPSPSRNDLTSRFITLCINEYYAVRGAAPSTNGPGRSD